MRRHFLALFFLGALSTNAIAYQADSQNLSSDKYFEATLNEINSAKSSVLVVMYLISALPDQPDSLPNQLIDAVIKAKDKGINVKVIVDQDMNFDVESTDEAVASNKNQKAYELLKKNNVPVFFDTSDTYTHSKVIVIDNETVILGSANWSKAALTRNNETSALIRSKEFAQSILSDLNKIKLMENPPQALTPKVEVPKDFLTNKKILPEMATQADERAFDTYLYLLKEFNQNKEGVLTLDYDHLATSLNINHMTTEDYRRQITKVLDKLKNKYNLIKFQDPKRNQNTQIQLITKDSKEYIRIPTTYWRYGWNNVLSFPAKVMYLINLSYAQTFPEPRFSISRITLSKTHGISESFISQGNQELRKLNLLDIQYSELEGKSYEERKPSTYTLKNLYDPKDLHKDLKKLEQQHGKEKLDHATKAAALVFQENNIQTIETLITLETQYGQAIIEEAKKKIAEKSIDNPKRSAGYLINTIKSIAKQK